MIAKTIGQTTHEAIASTSAAMALPEVETCSPWLGAAAGHVGSGGDWGVSGTAKPYPPTTDSATPPSTGYWPSEHPHRCTVDRVKRSGAATLVAAPSR